jgi:phenylacetate-CoA ligase
MTTGTEDATLWDAEVEAMPRERLREVQGEALARQVAHVYANGRLQRELYDAAGVRPADIATVDDLTRLPLFTKEHIRAARDASGDIFGGTACVPVDQLRLVNHSTGTSGAPTVYGLTATDTERVADIFARSMHGIGLRRGDRTLVAANSFWHGWVIGFEMGLQHLGAVPFRVSCSAATCVEKQFGGWRQADLTALRTFIPELEMSIFEKDDIDPRAIFPNARFVYAAIDVSAPKRRIIERIFGLPFRNMMGSGDQFFIGAECAHSAPYYHMPEDYFVFEVIDPVTEQPVPPGGVGELVVTNLWAEAFPYLRYRMGDIVTYENDPCPCGRTSMRMKVLGRLPWSVRVGGVRIFHGEVENVLWNRPEMEGAKYQLVRRRSQPQEALEVRVGPRSPVSSDVAEATRLEMSAAFDVPVVLTVVDPGELGLQNLIKMERLIEID